MDKTLIDYDKNLEELERQRENLKVVMQRMGQEWEERFVNLENVKKKINPFFNIVEQALDG